MFDWVNSFLNSLDKEGMTILATGFVAIVGATAAAIKGVKNGRPTQAALTDATEAITKISCGAPELSAAMREMNEQNRLALQRQGDMMTDIQRIRDQVAVIEDRTRNR